MLTTPQRSAHLMVQSQFLNSIVGPQLLNTMVGRHLLHTMVGTILNLFQYLPNYQPVSSGHDVIQPHFLSGVYYDNGDCHILCA